MSRHKVQATKLAGQGLLKATAGEFIIHRETIEIEVKHTALIGVARVAHADVRVETPGALGQCLVDRFGVVGRRDGDYVRVSRAAR